MDLCLEHSADKVVGEWKKKQLKKDLLELIDWAYHASFAEIYDYDRAKNKKKPTAETKKKINEFVKLYGK